MSYSLRFDVHVEFYEPRRFKWPVSNSLPSEYRRFERILRQQDGVGVEEPFFHADRFTIRAPESWTNETVYLLEGPVEDDFQHTIKIEVEQSARNISLVDYADWQVERQRHALPHARLLESGVESVPDNRSTYQALLMWSPSGGRTLFHHLCYVKSGRVAYHLTASSTEATRHQFEPQFRSIFRSFRPHEPLFVRR